MSSKEFLSAIKQRGISRSNRFRVILTLPAVLNTIPFPIGRDLSVRAEVASIPGYNVNTTEWNNHVGPSRKMPNGSLHDDFEMTFIASENLIEKKAFDEWTNWVVNRHNNRINFYDDYVSLLEVQQLDVNENVVHAVNLEEAYPIQVVSMPLNAGDSDTLHKVTVTFAYRKWAEKGEQAQSSQTFPLPDILSSISSAASGDGDFLRSSIETAKQVLRGAETNFTGESLNLFKQADQILRNSAGISGRDMERVVRVFEKSVKENQRITLRDSQNLLDVVDKIAGKFF